MRPTARPSLDVAGHGTVCVRDAATGKEIRRLQALAQRGWRPPLSRAKGETAFYTRGVHFADGGKALLLDAHTGQLRCHDGTTGKLLRQFALDGLLAGLSSDGKILFAFGGKEHLEIFLYDAATGKRRGRFRGEGKLHVAALAPDGKTLLAVNAAGRLFFWDVARGKLQCARFRYRRRKSRNETS